MSSVFISKGIYVPRNDEGFVDQATKPLAAVLGLKEDQVCSSITRLQAEHKGISTLCQDALKPVYKEKPIKIISTQRLPSR